MNIRDIDPYRLYALSEDELAEYLAMKAKERAAKERAAKDPLLGERLKTVRVLWRQPDTLALWGVPYDMREGQSPYDLWKREVLLRGSNVPLPVWTLPDWIWLGSPGWWGPYVRGGSERTAIEAFLAGLPEGAIPNGPCEWSRIDVDPSKEGA